MYVSKSQRRTWLLPLFEMGLLFSATYTWLTSPGRPGDSLVSTSHVAIGTLGLQVYTTSVILWVLGTWTQSLMLSQKAFYPTEPPSQDLRLHLYIHII